MEERGVGIWHGGVFGSSSSLEHHTNITHGIYYLDTLASHAVVVRIIISERGLSHNDGNRIDF